MFLWRMVLCEEVPCKHLEGSLVYMIFALFSLEKKPFGIHQNLFFRLLSHLVFQS